MPKASIIVPAFNVSATISRTLSSLLSQEFTDFEIVIVNDGSIDDTMTIVAPFLTDPRVRVVNQLNRGLAGARNSGILAAKGDYIGFCDADDLWLPSKLGAHVAHLDANPSVGVSFSGSQLIDDDDALLGINQSPKLRDISSADILRRNPIGNGSAPVIRRAVFKAIAYKPVSDGTRSWFFDETFRQSEDIECWMRIALMTDWGFEGVYGHLTQYRISSGALSSSTDRQLASWERMINKLEPMAPAFFAVHAPSARAYQYRYLCRRAISNADAKSAREYLGASLRASLAPLVREPVKSLVTMIATGVLTVLGAARFSQLVTRRKPLTHSA